LLSDGGSPKEENAGGGREKKKRKKKSSLPYASASCRGKKRTIASRGRKEKGKKKKRGLFSTRIASRKKWPSAREEEGEDHFSPDIIAHEVSNDQGEKKKKKEKKAI